MIAAPLEDGEWVQIPNGCKAAIAEYRDCPLPEYNTNPMIRALPPIFSISEFAERVSLLPQYSSQERDLEPHVRCHCVERLSRYFDPQQKTLQLQQVISVLVMQGYLARNPQMPVYAQRSHQIYAAIQDKGGKRLENYVSAPTSASSLTLIGPSGMGKSTNLQHILSLYPQVIVHPQSHGYQIVWLKVDCPHAGSLKGLCTDIFIAVDRLLGTNYFQKFGSGRNTEDYMLAQVAQIAHTHHLGVLAIDEMQNLTAAKRNSDELLNFLVKMDNVIGVPVIRIGTNEAFPIFQSNFRNARRGTGEGSVIWDRMQHDEEWRFFIEGMWDFQWTKTPVPFSQEISEAIYWETQGIIDIAIKLYKMVQWRAIALGGSEKIAVDSIHQVAADGLHLVKPMLEAIRSGNTERLAGYRDIAPIDTGAYRQKCLSELEKKELQQARVLARQQGDGASMSATLNRTILELLKLGVTPSIAKQLAAEVVASGDGNGDIQSLVARAFSLFIDGGHSAPPAKSRAQTKPRQKYGRDSIRLLVANAKKDKIPAYEALKQAGKVGDLIKDFLQG